MSVSFNQNVNGPGNTNASGTNSANSTQSTGLTSTGLDKNAFLQLLVAQMQYQDPMQPTNSSQFISQLAQFSSLEQMTNLAATETQVEQTLTGLENLNQVIAAHQLLGTQAQVDDGNGGTISGTVTAIRFKQGEPQLVIGGQDYSLSSVVQMGASS